MTYIRAVLIACTLFLGAGVCLPAASAQEVGSAERGAEIVSRWCTDCHSTGMTAEAGDIGPSFDETVGRRSPDYIRGFLANPHVRGAMPPFDLSREHIEDIVAYMQTLK